MKPIEEGFLDDRAFKHPYYEYLEERAQYGFTAAQFDIHRANYYCRTIWTIASVSKMIAAAHLNGDIETVINTRENLNDELGYGIKEKIHSELLLFSHNKHAELVFGLAPEKNLHDTKNSPLIIPETLDYCKMKKDLFADELLYSEMAGNMWVHELYADNMLRKFMNFFEPYECYYESEEAYKKTMEYFTSHLGGVEENHGILARRTALYLCQESIDNAAEIERGGKKFCLAQAKLWDGLLRELEKAERVGEVILPKPKTLIEVLGEKKEDQVVIHATPNISVAKPEIAKLFQTINEISK